MNPVKTSLLQRGALLIVAIVLVLVIAVLVLSLSFMAVSNIGSSGGHLSSAQALYIAESGIESALYRLHLPTFSCTSGMAETDTSVGQGRYTTIGTAFNPLPNSSQTVTSAMSVTGTIVPMTAITGFAPHGRVLIEFEEIDYSGTSISAAVCGTAPCLTGARRGAGGTAPAPHALGAGVNQNLCLIRSTGTAGTAVRVVERTVHVPDAMIVYSKAVGALAGTTDTPFYQIWNQVTSSWGGELAATPVTAVTQIRHMVIKFARTRNEAILGTLDTTGDIRVQVWNGFVWGPTQLLGNVTAGNSVFRGFDITYETGNDRAIVVYNNNTRNPAYRVWSGSAWSGEVTLDTQIGEQYPTASVPIWIDLARNPLRDSNEIVLITQKLNSAVFGARWNGTGWNVMPTIPPTATPTPAWGVTTGTDRMAIGVAYEQLSGQAFFIWADATAGQSQYRIWNGTSVSVANITLAGIPEAGNIGQWVRLVAQPNSNNLMYGVQDNDPDLRTMFWNGAAWGSNTLHDPSTEDVADRNFDIVFETHPARAGSAWIVWGDSLAISQRNWTGAGWDPIISPAGDDDTSLVQLLAQSGTGTVFAALYENTAALDPEELLALQLTGGSAIWSTPLQRIWPCLGVIFPCPDGTDGTTVGPLRTRTFFGARGYVSIGRHETYP